MFAMAEIPAYTPALIRVDQLLAAGEYDDAVELAEAIVADTRAADTLRALGRSRYERSTATYDEEEHEAALVALREAADAATDSRLRAEILSDLAAMLTGSVFFTPAKEEEAVRRYKEAYALEPTNVRALLGMALFRAHPEVAATRAQAIGWVEQAIALGAPEWWHWSELAKLYEEENDQQRAIAAYEEMLTLFPFGTGHPLEFVMRQQRKHLDALRTGRLELWDLHVIPNRE
jgi:tetratricopeptide (TPR) repeat protein